MDLLKIVPAHEDGTLLLTEEVPLGMGPGRWGRMVALMKACRAWTGLSPLFEGARGAAATAQDRLDGRAPTAPGYSRHNGQVQDRLPLPMLPVHSARHAPLTASRSEPW